jgi:hypothetical protein
MYPDTMKKHTTDYELSAEGQTKIEAVDGYLEQAIHDGRPLEALLATKRLGEIIDARAKEAARQATKASWSWTDVGHALGVSKQAAHQKLRSRIQDTIDKERSKLERAEQAGHAKIARRAEQGREALDRLPHAIPQVETARQRLSDWERSQHEKLSRGVQKGREGLTRAEQTVEDELNNG